MPTVESKLINMGYQLPPPPAPIGNYLSATRSGNIMWMAGVGSRKADGTRIAGKLGADLRWILARRSRVCATALREFWVSVTSRIRTTRGKSAVVKAHHVPHMFY